VTPFELVDEVATADAELRAWGPDLDEVFRAAGDATMNVMVRDLDTIRPRQRREVSLGHEAADLLLLNFLEELVYYKDAEGLMLRPERVEVTGGDDGGYALRASLAGEPLDPERHEQGADVKAVTLHRFTLERTQEGWAAYAILDI
jgi:SHS2 domain-containing protein